jgi:hypothetical protein
MEQRSAVTQSRITQFAHSRTTEREHDGTHPSSNLSGVFNHALSMPEREPPISNGGSPCGLPERKFRIGRYETAGKVSRNAEQQWQSGKKSKLNRFEYLNGFQICEGQVE